MEWLLQNKVLVARVYCDFLKDEPYLQLQEYAYDALSKRCKLGDDQRVSIEHEYKMEVPPKFSQWLTGVVDKTFFKHKAISGIVGADESNLEVSGMWVNQMMRGDQHQVHTHASSMYSFTAYLDVNDNDAPFYFISDNQGVPIYINRESLQHILIFPSDLVHTVLRKETDTPRISVSGNIVLNT